jgi:hypothetical protein
LASTHCQGSWWSCWGCCISWSIPYMLLLKISEHAYGLLCSTCSPVFDFILAFVFCALLGFHFLFLHVCWCVDDMLSDLKSL